MGMRAGARAPHFCHGRTSISARHLSPPQGLFHLAHNSKIASKNTASESEFRHRCLFVERLSVFPLSFLPLLPRILASVESMNLRSH